MPKKIFILFCTVLAIPLLMYAQHGKTGNIKGVVLTPEGEPLLGVTVILESPAIVVPSLETITDENGMYRFLSLPPGEYELIYSLPRMEKVIRKGIQLSAGETVTIDINIALRASEEFILVEGKAPAVDILNAKGETSLDIEFLRALSFLLNLVSKIPSN